MNVEDLYCALKDQILNGRLKTGERLGEVSLATQYNVSRLYVKSALQKLQAEGLVEHIANRGYFVLDLPDSLFEEIGDIRLALEGVIVKRVIRVGTQDEFDKLSKILGRIDVFIRSGMIEDGLEEVNKFYLTIYQISKYERVISILETYSSYFAFIRKHSATTLEEHLQSLESTNALFNAITARDEKAALYYLEERQRSYPPAL